jgi:uncharacterized membrane protein
MSTKKLQRLFEPEIAVPLAYLVFLAAAFLSFKVPVTRKHLLNSFSVGPGVMAYLTTIIGLGFFAFSTKLGKQIEVNRSGAVLGAIFISTTVVVYLTINVHIALALFAGAGYSVLLYYLSSQKEFHRLTNIVFALALLSTLSILVQGIPILSAATREKTAVSAGRALFHGFGVFAGALFVGFYSSRKAAAAVTVLAIAGLLSGFKSDAIAIILSASIAGLLLGKISTRAMAVTAAAIAFILTGVSTFIALVAHGVWNIPPYLYPLYRFGFTFSVYSKIVETSLPFGALHGLAIMSTTQEIVSTAVLGYSEPHIITSTLFGPLTLDFGIIGIILTALLIGVYLGAMKKDSTLRTCLYAMALTHVLVLIEVGLQLSSVMFLLSMMYLSIRERT